MTLLERRRALISAFTRFIKTVVGKLPLLLTACVNDKSTVGYKLYGESVQDGTPTPDNPVKVESVGELVTDETDENYGKYKIPVIASGKNLYQPKKDKLSGVYSGLKMSSWEQTYYTLQVSLKVGKTVPSGAYFGFLYGNSNANWLIQNGQLNTSIFGTSLTDTINSNKLNGVCCYPISKLDDFIDAFDVMLVKGSYTSKTMPAYEPYQEPITTNIYLDEPLRKIAIYNDYIDFENSKVVRNVAESKFLSSYLQGLSSSSSNTVLQALVSPSSPFGKAKTGAFDYSRKGYNSVGKVGHWNSTGSGVWWTNNTQGNTTTFFRISVSLLTTGGYENTLSGAKKWIDAQNNVNPIIITYILEKATSKIIDLPQLPTFKGTTIYSIDTSIQPSNMEVTYYSKERSVS